MKDAIKDLNHDIRNAVMAIKAHLLMLSKKHDFRNKDDKLILENIENSLKRIINATETISAVHGENCRGCKRAD